MRVRFFFPILICFVVGACSDDHTLFHLLDSQNTGIDFNNVIKINDSINILDNEFTYNGAGVAVGDLNNDGLQDIYFCGNQVPNRLYLNKGGLRFQEITDVAGVQKKKGQWSSGVTFVDINADGLQDIYVCNTMMHDSLLLRDLLFINEGNDKTGIPHFREMGTEYGIKDDNHNSISTFLDYDNDGDLDMFVAVNFIDMQYPNQYITKIGDGKAPTRDLLFRNDWDSVLGHPVFTDISLTAGIIWGGYSHSCLVHDFNKDGYPDIYVANDYLTNDLVYINNRNGTFTNRAAEVLKHQSYSSMGSDIADINNDGNGDLFTVEMLPADNKRKKVNMGANNYNHYLFTEQYKYEYQFVRNTFQVYQGMDPENGLPVYSDIAFLAGLEATDWSWSPLFADFDNDGYRDLIITNGFPKDIIDHDFGAFRSSINSSLITRNELMNMIPEVKIPNYIFKNNGDLTFSDKSEEWGVNKKSFTNGTAYADLDNDGDVDIITNNINDPAFLFENTLYSKDTKTKKDNNTPNYLRIQLKGPSLNEAGFGAKVRIWTKGMLQAAESECVRGYLSRSEPYLHFGLGEHSMVDSIQVDWSDGRVQRMKSVQANQLIQLKYADAASGQKTKEVSAVTLLKKINPTDLGITYSHEENDFIDFNLQKTLPHKFSQYGPGIAVGDINGDSLDDMVLSSSSRFQGPVVLQQTRDGKFIQRVLPIKRTEQMKEEDMGLLLFDADSDGDNDLYIVRGSNQHDSGSVLYQDALCINDGRGNFSADTTSLPKITSTGQNVKAADMDGDGDLDLFVGARLAAKAYPKPGESFLLRNDSKPGLVRFTDVTETWYKPLRYIGMVSDALWSDFDNDHKPDLILACEWMPLVFLRNTGFGFIQVELGDTLSNAKGWWNSLAAGDFDMDGDMDYVAGNFGLNQYFKCSSSEPLRIYSKDFDNNGSYDAFISCFFPDSTGTRHEYFFHSKDDMQKQLILVRKKFEKYADFGRATVKDVFTPEEMKGVDIKTANFMRSIWIENKGGGSFVMYPLPIEAQMAPLYGIQIADVNNDLYPDILMVGNDYGMETGQGRADAFNGLVLISIGGKKFAPLTFEQSGFFVPGDARAVALVNIGNKLFFAATQNRKGLSLFSGASSEQKNIRLRPDESVATVEYSNGKKQRFEFCYGSSFMAQNSRTVPFSLSCNKIIFTNQAGKITREVRINK